MDTAWRRILANVVRDMKRQILQTGIEANDFEQKKKCIFASLAVSPYAIIVQTVSASLLKNAFANWDLSGIISSKNALRSAGQNAGPTESALRRTNADSQCENTVFVFILATVIVCFSLKEYGICNVRLFAWCMFGGSGNSLFWNWNTTLFLS